MMTNSFSDRQRGGPVKTVVPQHLSRQSTFFSSWCLCCCLRRRHPSRFFSSWRLSPSARRRSYSCEWDDDVKDGGEDECPKQETLARVLKIAVFAASILLIFFAIALGCSSSLSTCTFSTQQQHDWLLPESEVAGDTGQPQSLVTAAHRQP